MNRKQSARRVSNSTIAVWKHGSGSGLRHSMVVNSRTKMLAHAQIMDGSNQPSAPSVRTFMVNRPKVRTHFAGDSWVSLTASCDPPSSSSLRLCPSITGIASRRSVSCSAVASRRLRRRVARCQSISLCIGSRSVDHAQDASLFEMNKKIHVSAFKAKAPDP